MQELAASLDRESEQYGTGELRKCAERWASHALNTYKGKLLRKALDISASLVEFQNEIEPHE